MFKRFLISYVAILLVPLITGFVTYYAAIDLAKSNSIDSSLSVLNQSKSLLEQRLAEVESFAQQLAINPDIVNVLNLEGDVKDHAYSLWKAAKNISGYARTNDYLKTFYIYLHKFDVVLTPGFVFYRPMHFYALVQEYDRTYEDWQQSLSDTYQGNFTPSRQVLLNNREAAYISYKQTLPMNRFNDPLGTITVHIDARKISQLFNSFSDHFAGWAAITDQAGETIVTNGIEPADFHALEWTPTNEEQAYVLSDDTLFISIESQETGWTYTAGIPTEALFANAQLIKRMTLTVTTVTLLVGLLICLWLAYRNSLPLSRLVNIFQEDEYKLDALTNDYDFLKGSISTLVKNNRNLKVEMEKQKPMISDAFVHRLLNGEFFTLHRFAQSAEHSGITLQGEYGFVAILQIFRFAGQQEIDHYYEVQAIRVYIKQQLKKQASELIVTDLQSDKIVCLFTTNDANERACADDVEARLVDFSKRLEQETNIVLTVSIGSFFKKLADINRSFEEAKQVIHYATPSHQADRILWYKSTSHKNNLYYYPIHIELRLIEAIKSGEAEEALRIMDQLYEHNFEQQQLPVDMAYLFMEEMKATFVKSFDQRLYQTPLKVQTTWSDLKQMVAQYCSFVNEKKNETNAIMIKQAIAFIEHAYSDANLTIHHVAEHVNESEKRLSQLFKEQTGEYMSDYVERIRLNKAAELLLTPSYSIESIAKNVGYNSAHSFRRAFKRTFEMTPVQYRFMRTKQANTQIVP